MFCPKCGTQLPDDAQFCAKCGAQVNGAPAGAPAAAPAKPARTREPYKAPDTRGWISIGFTTLVFLLMFVPFIDAGPSVSLLAVEAFQIQALFGVAKIFMIVSIAIYFGNLVLNFMDLGLPSIIKKFVPLGMYATFVFAQLFVFIGCCIRNGVTMGAAWYIILLAVGVAVVFELLPGLFAVCKKDDKK